MTRISRFPLNEKVLEKLFDLFFEIVGRKKNKEEFLKTIYDLLSPVERIMIAKRIAIIYLLLKKIDYVTICDVLKVSPSTVAKFNLLMEKSDGIVPAFKEILTNEKVKIFLEDLFLALYGPGTPGVDWHSAWKDKLDLKRRKEIGI
jgi:uncharacterized protein YerC